jgi:uncharacterized membrane protein YhaH (DUF805 family)
LSWLKDFTTYHGRLNRIQLLWRHAALCFIGAVAAMLLFAAVSAITSTNTAFAFAMLIVMIPVLYADISLVVRRFHDVGLPGWWLLPIFGLAGALFALMITWPSPWLMLAIFPVNFGYLILLFLVPGSRGANRYGEPPALP